MDDVASVRSENANLRKIQSKLLQWDSSLAPLSQFQLDTISELTQIYEKPEIISPDTNRASEDDAGIEESGQDEQSVFAKFNSSNVAIESTQDFLSWYNTIDSEILENFDDVYLEYYNQLADRTQECDKILKEIDISLNSLNSLSKEYEFVSNKTSSLHTASENLLQDQNKLNSISEEIRTRLKYFNQVESISQRLQNPTFSVASDAFADILNTIDDCLEYIKSKPKFKDSAAYSIKYKHSLAKAIQMMKNYVTQIFVNATEQVVAPTKSNPDESTDKSSDAAFALFYGKFQSFAGRAKKITALIEERYEKNSEYEQLLLELHQSYLAQRALIMSMSVETAIKDLTGKHKGDHCALVRSSCAFLVHVCQDEHRLFYQFFTVPSSQLTGYMEGICVILYDNLRPFIIHINHLETLAEICSILRIEMLEEHVHHNPESLEAFGKIIFQLLQDVQERLVFRAHMYLQSDILHYNPSAGDLAYPDKLEMMESIALSLQESHMRRCDSRNSMISMGSNQDMMTDQQFKSRTGNSPADLHGMWYPTVRRTLVCLSRLYRCIDRPIFQGLSQEALTHCIQSISNAATSISANKTSIDGELFEIKHLLILREQIAPFRVDFTVKETSLDFSKVKTAAFELLQKRKQLFALGSNNALLEFLLEGTPQVKEQLLDSRKDVDRQLKAVCEIFIKDITRQLVGPIITFIDNAQNLLKQTTAATTSKANFTLRQTPWASPQQISSLIQESQRNIKLKLTKIQRSMQLYLSNKDTEFILFRPIRNNIIGGVVKLEQILTTNGYSKDDLIIVSCPSAEQISVLISSASLNVDGGPPPTLTRQHSSRKTSLSSVENEKIATAGNLEKKVSFDSEVVNVIKEVENDSEETPNTEA